MTDQHQAPIGTVAEEATRLVAAMAAMAAKPRPGAVPSDGPTLIASSYAGEPAQEPVPPGTDHESRPEQTTPPADPPPEHAPSSGPSSAGPGGTRACSACGGESGGEGDGTPVACRLCPLCQGIALLRSVRPETVDRLADLASALEAGLRDMATQSRASGPASDAGSGSGRPSDRPTVQDIRVDDEDAR